MLSLDRLIAARGRQAFDRTIESTINHFYEGTDLCKSGVGLATAMLELLRLEGVGDFGPSTQPWP